MKFIQPTEQKQPTQTLSSVAMIFNDRYLEEIDGYQTLNVSGREMLSYDIQSDRRSGDGSIRYGKTKPSRVITVQYKLEASTAEELQAKYNELRRYLHSDDLVPIRFLDEPDTVYFGEFEGAESIPPERLTVVSSFTIFCPDPEKYSKLTETNGEINIDTFYKTYPEKITVVTDSATNAIDITNGEQTIQLRGEMNAGSRIELFVKEQELLFNGRERRDFIDLHSDFENFEIKNGQTITTSNGSLKVEMREIK